MSITDAAPDRRWRLRIAVYQSDFGSVLTTHVRTDDQGSWSFSDQMIGGRQRIDVSSRTKSGKRCAIEVEARISPLG